MAEGKKKKKPKVPPPPTEDAVELLVQELTQREPEATAERRLEIVLEIREGILRLGGINVAWDQLTHTRKGYGAHAGLQVLVSMLGGVQVDDAKPPNIDRTCIEPAAQLLAFFCNFKQYAKVIAKTKKMLPVLVGVLKDWKCTGTARASATWVLRRCTEFNSQCGQEMASNKDTIVLLTRVMMSDDLKPTDDSADVLTIGGSRSSTPKILSRNPSAMSRNMSARSTGSMTISNPMRSKSPGPVAQRALATPSSTESPLGPSAASLKAPATSASLPSGLDLGPPVTASRPPRPITAKSSGTHQGSFRASRPGTAVMHTSRPVTASSMRRPETAHASRPGTALRPGTSGTIFSMTNIRSDAMCMEANCCAAIGNAALREDCLERLGQSDGLLAAIIHLLGNGTYWAQGHAARTLGNLVTCLPNLKLLAKIDVRNTAAHTLHGVLVNSDISNSSKEHALHAIGNMVRSSTFCVVFNQMHGIHTTLVRLKEDGLSKDAADRITTCLSQHRLGTRTWRPPTQVMA